MEQKNKKSLDVQKGETVITLLAVETSSKLGRRRSSSAIGSKVHQCSDSRDPFDESMVLNQGPRSRIYRRLQVKGGQFCKYSAGRAKLIFLDNIPAYCTT
jgi:hypothetical protein